MRLGFSFKRYRFWVWLLFCALAVVLVPVLARVLGLEGYAGFGLWVAFLLLAVLPVWEWVRIGRLRLGSGEVLTASKLRRVWNVVWLGAPMGLWTAIAVLHLVLGRVALDLTAHRAVLGLYSALQDVSLVIVFLLLLPLYRKLYSGEPQAAVSPGVGATGNGGLDHVSLSGEPQAAVSPGVSATGNGGLDHVSLSGEPQAAVSPGVSATGNGGLDHVSLSGEPQAEKDSVVELPVDVAHEREMLSDSPQNAENTGAEVPGGGLSFPRGLSPVLFSLLGLVVVAWLTGGWVVDLLFAGDGGVLLPANVSQRLVLTMFVLSEGLIFVSLAAHKGYESIGRYGIMISMLLLTLFLYAMLLVSFSIYPGGINLVSVVVALIAARLVYVVIAWLGFRLKMRREAAVAPSEE
jgi:hypothetical protein